MRRPISSACRLFRSGLVALGCSACWCVDPAVAAITVGHVDDFQDGTTQHWRIGVENPYPQVDPDSGPLGDGDFALFHTNTQPQAPFRLIMLNEANLGNPGPGNWQGDWTSAGVTQISFDIRNPGTALGASNLAMRVGIAGPGEGGVSQFGDIYYTNPQIVPPDNLWYTLTFDVAPSDFRYGGIFTGDIDAALADVIHFRIYSNAQESFIGSGNPNEFFIDNIRAIGAPAGVAGDYNEDGAVDAADYVLWRSMLDDEVPPGTGADGTGPGGAPDGVIDMLDYEYWRARFGNPQAGGSSLQLTSGPGLAAVPEPAAQSMLLLAVAGLWAGGLRFSRS